MLAFFFFFFANAISSLRSSFQDGFNFHPLMFQNLSYFSSFTLCGTGRKPIPAARTHSVSSKVSLGLCRLLFYVVESLFSMYHQSFRPNGLLIFAPGYLL
jgi:hypothetical protein